MPRKKNDGRGRLGGREKGTPNKVTADLRECIKLLIDDNWEQVQQDIKELEPKDRLAFLEKMLRYVVPQESKVMQTCDSSALMEQIRADEPDLANWIAQKYLKDLSYVTEMMIPPPETFADYIEKKDGYIRF